MTDRYQNAIDTQQIKRFGDRSQGLYLSTGMHLWSNLAARRPMTSAGRNGSTTLPSTLAGDRAPSGRQTRQP
jgi:hypothetical protein